MTEEMTTEIINIYGGETVRIRRAKSSDAERVAAFGAKAFVRTFVEEFKIPYPEQELKRYLDESYDKNVFESWISSSKHCLWVAELVGDDKDDCTIAGYCAAGPCTLPHGDVSAENGELYKLYIDPAFFGSSLAQALFSLAETFLKSGVYSGKLRYLSVWSENIRAQKFYERNGYGFLSEYEYPVGDHRDREFIYRSKE